MKRLFYPALVVIGSVSAGPAAVAGGAASPIMKGPWLQHVTTTSAIVRVEVDPPAPVMLELGGSGAPDSGPGTVVESREVRALHSILVGNLEPATRYPITVRARGAQKLGAITTAPRDDSAAPFRFLVYGDNRTDDTTHAALVRAMLAVPSDFLVNTGDFVERGASAPQWQTFFDIEAPLLRERCLFSCVGNHELVDGAGIQYVRYLGPADAPVADGASLALEQLSGTFRWSNARFFLVNGMVDYAAGPTRAWLEKALTDADNEAGLVWRIVVIHHGARSSGPHGGNPHLRDAKIPELLRAHKIDLMIAGHDHIYERGLSDGLPYLVTGGGGAPLYRVKKAEATSLHYESVHHFIDASVTASAIQLVATRPDGSTIERCALHKDVGWDCDGPSGPTHTGSASTLPPEPPVASRSKCGCDVVGAASHEESWLASLVIAGVMVAVRRRRAAIQGACAGRQVR